MKRLKTSFYSGLIAILPIVITLYIFNWMLHFFLDLLQNSFITTGISKIVSEFLIEEGQKRQLYSHILINLVSFIFIILTILLIGKLMKMFFFRKLSDFFNNLFIKIPLFSQVYSTITQIISLLNSEKSNKGQQVVAIEYPRKGVYSIGFMTSENNILIEDITKEEMCNVFIPTSPNPTSGFFVILKKTDVIVIDLKVEEAVKLIVSGGVVLPEKLKRRD